VRCDDIKVEAEAEVKINDKRERVKVWNLTL
jgi:hypothetical protein